ncbi:MAG TPA: hypothetical protein VMT34_12210 [Aggregatilineales bacterium]|nr:hypothetical protein [Aggregatilineales bacterium]
MPKVPAPELIGETLVGQVFSLRDTAILVVGDPPSLLTGQPLLFAGSLIARYAIPMYAPATDAVIPGLLVGERGGFLVGREAWTFIQTKFQLFPRADVVGRHLDGSDAQVFLRELDLARPVRVLVYDARQPDSAPVAEVSGLIVGTGAPELPALLVKHLPILPDSAPLVKPS